MGDDGGDIEAALDEGSHFIPGFIHFAAVNAADGEHIEDDFIPIDGGFARHDAEESDASAVAHVVDHISQGGGVA